jgi:hypothetical protein
MHIGQGRIHGTGRATYPALVGIATSLKISEASTPNMHDTIIDPFLFSMKFIGEINPNMHIKSFGQVAEVGIQLRVFLTSHRSESQSNAMIGSAKYIRYSFSSSRRLSHCSLMLSLLCNVL